MVFKKSIKHLRSNFSQYFVFEALIVILTSTFILPKILRLYQWAMVQSGTPVIINIDLLKPDLYSARFWVMLGGIVFFVLLLVAEYIILIVMVDANRRNQPLTLIGAVFVGIKNFPRMLWPSLLQIVSLGIIFVPALITNQLNIVNIPITIYEWLLGIKKIEPYWIIIILLWIYFHIHTLFLMYLILIENKTTKEAFLESFRLVRKHQFKVIISWLPFLLLLLVGVLFFSVFVNISVQVIVVLEIYATIKYVIVYLLSIVLYSVILSILPLMITYLIMLYHDIVSTGKPTVNTNSTIGGVTREDGNLFYKPRFAKWPRWIKKSHKLLNLALTFLILASLGVNYIIIKSSVKWDVKIAAHRGDSGYAPENSLSSIQSAIDKQVEVVELDVMMSGDGVLILHHDLTLNRTAGVDLKLSDLLYSELDNFDIRIRKNTIFEGEKIPTLRQALELSKGKIYVLLDIKDQGNAEYLVPEVVKMIEEMDMVDAVSIQSFSPKVLKTVRDMSPNIKIGQIIYSYTGDLSKLEVDFLTIKYNILNDDIVKIAHGLDKEIWVWTVNSSVNLYEVFRYDIDAIITDYPERAQSVRSLTR